MHSKRIAALVLAVVMACTIASPAFAATTWTPSNGQASDLENDLVSIRISAAENAVYGSPVNVTITADPADTMYLAVVLGTSGEAKGFVTLLLPEKVRILLELIPLPSSMSANPALAGNFNLYEYIKQLIDGNDVNVLLRVADEVTDVMHSLTYYVPSLGDIVVGLRQALTLIRKYLPAGVATRIYVDEQPSDSGRYIAAAVTLDRGDINTAGIAIIKVAQKSTNVRQYWAEQTPATMTVEQAQSFNFNAVTEADGAVVTDSRVSYTYKNNSGTASYNSNVPPTEPGSYTQIAELDSNYKADKISRSFTIVG